MADPQIARAAFLFAHPTRARLCQLLLDGRFHTAGELARAGEVSASTASEHLALLLDAGILDTARQGRHRYYRLDSPPAASALEALGLLAPPETPRPSLRHSRADAALRAARTCYDHLAGRLGVQMTAGLVTTGVLTAELAVRDLAPLAPLGLRLDTGSRTPLARGCLDWTERTHHLAGRLATALLHRLLELTWLQRQTDTRAVTLSPTGRAELAALAILPPEETTTSPAAATPPRTSRDAPALLRRP